MIEPGERYHLRVAGRVQGVGFRWFVREEARRLNVAGWVRNLPTGEVEIFAEGSRESLEELARRVAEGPPGARVEVVHRLPPPDGTGALPTPFAIQR